MATERFDPSDGERWATYIQWAKIPGSTEVVILDCVLCRHLPRQNQRQDEAWRHIVCEDFRLDYFNDLDYLRKRFHGAKRRNILSLYGNP
jgi:hypothetical protein